MAPTSFTTDRRERLLSAGVELFKRNAYEEVSTERVAESAGVAQGLLFHYFGTKRKFFVEVLRRMVEQQSSGFESNRHANPVQWLRKEVDTFLFGLLEYPPPNIIAGYGLDKDMQAFIDEQQDKAVERLVTRMGIDEPSPLLYVALRGWAGYSLAAGTKWLSTPAVNRSQIIDLLIGALNATLDHVAKVEIDAGWDSRFFLRARPSGQSTIVKRRTSTLTRNPSQR